MHVKSMITFSVRMIEYIKVKKKNKKLYVYEIGKF